MECCICHGKIETHIHPSTGKPYWTQGHNAVPVKDGRCCDNCNQFVVLPTRLKHIEFFINGQTNDDSFHTIKEEVVDKLLDNLEEVVDKLTDRRKDNAQSFNPSSS